MVKLNLSLYSLYNAKAYNKLAGPISTSSCPGNTASFKDMSQRWQAIGNTVSELTSLKFEPKTSCSRDDRNNCSTNWPVHINGDNHISQNMIAKDLDKTDEKRVTKIRVKERGSN